MFQVALLHGAFRRKDRCCALRQEVDPAGQRGEPRAQRRFGHGQCAHQVRTICRQTQNNVRAERKTDQVDTSQPECSDQRNQITRMGVG